MRLLGLSGHATDALVSEEEIKHIVHEGANQGIFDEAERELIHSVFEFTDTSVREVMVPRSDVHGIDLATASREALTQMLETGFSRAPVYEGDLDRIVGIVHIKELLRAVHEENTASLQSILHPALFVPDSMQISDLLRELQTRRTHMAIVLNEYGTVIGLATIEDLLEEIVGEIRDEFDIDEEAPVQELNDGSLLVEGSVPLTDLHEKYGLPLEETDRYRTIGGFVLARLKRIPKGGEAVTYAGHKMTIVTIDGRRLRKVRIERPRAVERPDAEGKQPPS
jgi:putative hemolysin